jgi:hypothetical protein
MRCGLPNSLPSSSDSTAAAFALPEDCLYANFVATLDGIVAIPPDAPLQRVRRRWQRR